MSIEFSDPLERHRNNRFGLFIHWGIYAVGGIHEQHQFRLSLTREEYQPLMREFNPVEFNPDEWIDIAQDAGMSYIVITAKHIDGFCLWDTQHTEFKVTNTPYGKDIIAELAEACHRRSFPLGIYYSIADMAQENYPWGGRRYELAEADPNDEPDIERYREYMREQVRELCTNYGRVQYFWWDGNELEFEDSSFNAMIRELQPGILINNRGPDKGDYGTPERESHLAETGPLLEHEKLTEYCSALGYESWGYRSNEDYYGLRYLQECIAIAMAKGGNYLLNAGPDALGRIPVQQVEILQALGEWQCKVGEAFAGTKPASKLTDNRQVLLTRNHKDLYVVIAQQPMTNAMMLNPIKCEPRSAVLLNTGEEVEAVCEYMPNFYLSEHHLLRLKNLPVNDLPGQVLVVKLSFDEEADFHG